MSGLFTISERLHAGLILLSELAASPDRLHSLREIADGMEISEGYLEEVAALLRRSGLVEGKRGSAGGYRLARPIDGITLLDVVTAIEGPVALVPCQNAHENTCQVSERCRTKRLWSSVQSHLLDSLRQKTLRDVLTV